MTPDGKYYGLCDGHDAEDHELFGPTASRSGSGSGGGLAIRGEGRDEQRTGLYMSVLSTTISVYSVVCLVISRAMCR
jgi:hypothetical protein